LSELPPAGWYKDPARVHAHRYWDGDRWTDGVTDKKGVVGQDPLPADGAALAWAERTDERPQFSAWIGLLAIGMFLVASVVAAFFALAGDAVSPAAALLLGAIGNYGCLFLVCWWISRWKGTGNMRRDFGLRAGWGDSWRGLLVSFGAQVSLVIVSAIVTLFSSDLVGSNTEQFDDHKDSIVFVACVAVVALLLAPFFEELYFRGLIMQSFAGSFPLPVAIVVQGALFGMAHLGGAEGAGNVGLVLSLSAVGIVFGVCTHRFGRMGPNMAAHLCFNLPSVIVLLSSR
jgi:membrane protease YdiL (CAAX protease family)